MEGALEEVGAALVVEAGIAGAEEVELLAEPVVPGEGVGALCSQPVLAHMPSATIVPSQTPTFDRIARL